MPITPGNRGEPIPVTDQEVWAECNERLRIAIEAEGDNRARGMQCLDFLDGHQWSDDLYNQRRIAKRPSLTINHTRTFRNRVVNNMKIQRPRMKVHAVGDGADDEKAEVIGGILRHIENLSKADIAYDTGGASAVDIGWGYARVMADFADERSMEQEILIKPIRNTFQVYMDPSATLPAGEDADWVILTETMKRAEYKRQYPKAQNVEFLFTGAGDNQRMWETKHTIRLAEYYRIARRTETLYQFSNGMTLFADEARKLQSKLDAVSAQITMQRPSTRRTVEWFRVNGRTVVERRAYGGNEARGEGPLPGRFIPIVRFLGNVLDVDGRVKFKGMIEDLIGPAQMYNYWRTAETEQLALASKAPWVGPQGFRDGRPEWDDANQTPYSSLEYNIVTIEQPDGSKTALPPPTRNPAIEVPAGFVEAAKGAQGDLMAVAGMPHEPGQDTPGVVVSGRALERRQALSDIGHFQYYDNQTRAIQHIGRICLEWIPIYYSAARMQRIIGEDGVPSMVAINQPGAPDPQNAAIMAIKNDMTVGRYDVVMDTGPGYESKRMEESEKAVDLMRIGPLAEVATKNAADLIFRYFGMDDIADRLATQNPAGMQKAMEALPKQAQAMVQGFIAKLNQANQKISQLEADLKFSLTKTLHQDSTRMAIEHLKDKRAEKDTATDAQTKVFDTHVRSVTARDVAEIHAAGALLDTHASASHAARAAELAAARGAEREPIQ
jgi:hypothetical protein